MVTREDHHNLCQLYTTYGIENVIEKYYQKLNEKISNHQALLEGEKYCEISSVSSYSNRNIDLLLMLFLQIIQQKIF
ncbi:MAG: hypothetical protein AYK18_07905 [Theionarchaea archaeon DG-70]|nr:MAG: hypothetical protein AYK18_07905 [Theionarchaea archaeon DG-70]MBU7026944.1 hypothetical protein [Theionarchaea archaeon]